MRLSYLIFIASGISLLALPSSAQSRFERSAAYRSTFAEEHPGAVVQVDSVDGSLELIMGARMGGPYGTPTDLAKEFLERDLPNLDPTVPLGSSFDVVRMWDTKAGGRRILLKNRRMMPGQGFLVGVNRRRHGLRQYIDDRDHVAPPGYVFITTTEAIDYDEPRSDWYIYFVRKSLDPDEPALAEQQNPNVRLGATGESDTVGNDWKQDHSVEQTAPSSGVEASGNPLCPSDDYSLTATGYGYLSNPIHGNPEMLELANLCNQSPYVLEGRHVSVTPSSGERISSQDGSFIFQPNDPGFDQVSVYNHMDRFLTMMFDLGYPWPGPEWRVEGVTGSSATTTAYTRFPALRVVFGIPEPPYRNAAQEAALIAHETTHVLLARISASYTGWGDKEHWALGEAYPDYFGLVYRSLQRGLDGPWLAPVFGEYVAMQTSQDLPRDLSSDLPNYSGYFTINYVGLSDGPLPVNKYDHSIIFSSALLDFDQIDGSEDSPSFVIESLFNVSSTPTFRDARDALMIAASECAVSQQPSTYVCCEESACSSSVAQAFSERGISGASEGIAYGTDVSGREVPLDELIAEIEAYPIPFSESATITFTLSRSAQTRLLIFNTEGKHVKTLVDRILPSGRHTIDWRPTTNPSGRYFFELAADAFVKRGVLIYVR